MISPGSRVFLPASEEQSEEGGDRRGMPEASRRKTLSPGRVMELVADLTSRLPNGKLALRFEAGRLVDVTVEQSIEE